MRHAEGVATAVDRDRVSDPKLEQWPRRKIVLRSIRHFEKKPLGKPQGLAGRPDRSGGLAGRRPVYFPLRPLHNPPVPRFKCSSQSGPRERRGRIMVSRVLAIVGAVAFAIAVTLAGLGSRRWNGE